MKKQTWLIILAIGLIAGCALQEKKAEDSADKKVAEQEEQLGQARAAADYSPSVLPVPDPQEALKANSLPGMNNAATFPEEEEIKKMKEFVAGQDKELEESAKAKK